MYRGDGDIRVCVCVLECMYRGDGDIRVCVCVLGCMYECVCVCVCRDDHPRVRANVKRVIEIDLIKAKGPY
jgi:hypothetical protein